MRMRRCLQPVGGEGQEVEGFRVGVEWQEIKDRRLQGFGVGGPRCMAQP